MDSEIWKGLRNYDKKYEVSNLGNVRFKDTKKLLNQYTNRKYKYVALYFNGKTHTCRVHRLIAQEFCKDYCKECVVMHLDNNPANNNAENLKCGTQKENIIQCLNEKRLHIPAKFKKINQYDLQGNFIKEWNGQTTIQRILGYKQSKISMCCTGRKKTAYGYLWRFASERSEAV